MRNPKSFRAGLLMAIVSVTIGPAHSRSQAQEPWPAIPPHPIPGGRPTTTAPAAGQWKLILSMHGKQIAVHPIDIAEPDKPMTMDLKFADLGPAGELWLQGYFPHATVDVEFHRDVPDGKPAIKLHVEGPQVQVDRWLIAGDLNHQVLRSQVAKWTAFLVRDPQQIERFVQRHRQQEQHNQVLIVSTLDQTASEVFTDLQPGRVLSVPDTDVTIKVLRYMPWCSYDLKTKKIANVGDKPINPALEVEVTTNGTSSTHLVFARQDANRAHQSASGQPPPVDLRFHQRVTSLAKTPVFNLFVQPPKDITLVTVLGEMANAIPISQGDEIQVPNSPFRFQVAELVEHAKLIEHWQATNKAGDRAALRVGHRRADGSVHVVWIAPNSSKRVALSNGFFELRLIPTSAGGAGLPPHHPSTAVSPSPRHLPADSHP